MGGEGVDEWGHGRRGGQKINRRKMKLEKREGRKTKVVRMTRKMRGEWNEGEKTKRMKVKREKRNNLHDKD